MRSHACEFARETVVRERVGVKGKEREISMLEPCDRGRKEESRSLRFFDYSEKRRRRRREKERRRKK